MLYTTCIVPAVPRKYKYIYQSSSLSSPLLFLNPPRIPLFPLLLSFSSSESSSSKSDRDPCCFWVRSEEDTLVANVRSVGRTPVCESRNSRALVVKLSVWPSSSKPINLSLSKSSQRNGQVSPILLRDYWQLPVLYSSNEYVVTLTMTYRSTALPSTYDITQGRTLIAILVTKNGTLSTFARRKRVCLCFGASCCTLHVHVSMSNHSGRR